jgi:ABC-type spermidine/putrescine transport system permease subunit I
MSARRSGQWWLATPAVALIALGFALPMLFMLRMSLNGTERRPYAPGFTLENYAHFFEPLYLGLLWRTVRLTLVITAASVLIGVPYAYVLWRSSGVRRGLLLAISLLPLFTNVIARLYGWQILLANRGPVNRALELLGLVDEPLRLNYSFIGAAVGLTYVAAPYFTLIYFSALSGVDHQLVLAARTLGAGRLRAVAGVVLPLSAYGLATGIAVAFAWGMGAYAETVTLGSSQEWGLGYEAWRQHSLARNWPFSSVLSVAIVVATLALVMVAAWATVRTVRGMRPEEA